MTLAATIGNIVAGDDLERSLIDMARRPWRTPRLPPLVGPKEACEILGVNKMTLNRWLQPGSAKIGGYGPDKTYMIPPATHGPAATPVWVRSDVEQFAEVIGRQRAPFRSPRKRSTPSDTVGDAEVLEILGISKSTLTRWLKPGSGEYGPDRTRKIAPVSKPGAVREWARADVERFRDEI